MKLATIKLGFLLLICCAMTRQLNAQLNPLATLYFQNEYLGNPAMAGSAQGLNVNLALSKQWGSIPGSPLSQSVTATYSSGNKVATGLNIYNDVSGLFKRTRVLGSYSYALPLNDNSRALRFGISLGFENQRISTEDINGDNSDDLIAAYNVQDTYVDGDFGVAYTSNRLTIQGAVPEMKRFFRKDALSRVTNRALFFSAISYKLLMLAEQDIRLEPKLVYRGIRGFGNILDAGMSLSFIENKLNFFGMYHSTRSNTFGMGMNYQSIGINAMYTTTTSQLNNYANGSFEISLKANLVN